MKTLALITTHKGEQKLSAFSAEVIKPAYAVDVTEQLNSYVTSDVYKRQRMSALN